MPIIRARAKKKMRNKTRNKKKCGIKRGIKKKCGIKRGIAEKNAELKIAPGTSTWYNKTENTHETNRQKNVDALR